jgi:hypothetical protein
MRKSGSTKDLHLPKNAPALTHLAAEDQVLRIDSAMNLARLFA